VKPRVKDAAHSALFGKAILAELSRNPRGIDFGNGPESSTFQLLTTGKPVDRPAFVYFRGGPRCRAVEWAQQWPRWRTSRNTCRTSSRVAGLPADIDRVRHCVVSCRSGGVFGKRSATFGNRRGPAAGGRVTSESDPGHRVSPPRRRSRTLSSLSSGYRGATPPGPGDTAIWADEARATLPPEAPHVLSNADRSRERTTVRRCTAGKHGIRPERPRRSEPVRDAPARLYTV
jgi:hypothetical protein